MTAPSNITHSAAPASVAIIGAGISGLCCATLLQDAGIRVQVFDKSRGTGGRMSTRRGEGWQCDHGAQYFTARNPAFRAEVARWESMGVAGPWNPRLKVFNNGKTEEHTSSVERFVAIHRMSAAARLLADRLPVRLETTIREIARENGQWRLCSGEHGWLEDRYDQVLLAVPSPQAAPLLTPWSPGLAGLATSANMRGCWALMLRFSSPVDLPFDGAFVNGGPLSWIARDSNKPGRSGMETWLLHATPEWSEAHTESTGDAVAETLLAAFRQLGGPQPDAWSAHRWRYADTSPALEIGCAWDADPRLGLCGDWLNGGKVEGAWLSGRALARQVLETFTAD